MADLFVRSYPRTPAVAPHGATVTIRPRPGVATEVAVGGAAPDPAIATSPTPPILPEETHDMKESLDRPTQGHVDQDHPPDPPADDSPAPADDPPAGIAAVTAAETDPPAPDLLEGRVVEPTADPVGVAPPVDPSADGDPPAAGPGASETSPAADPDASPELEGEPPPPPRGDSGGQEGAVLELDMAPVMVAAVIDDAIAGADEAVSPSPGGLDTGETDHEDLLQPLESTSPRVGPESQRVGPPGWDDATVASHGHRHHQEQRREENTMSECNCGKPGCTTCCVDCNTGWIQADLREGNLNFRTTETNASNNAQGAIRDIQLAKSQLAELANRGFAAGALADCNTQQAVHHEGATSRLEQAHAELRAANIAAANAAVAASAACRTDQLIQTTAFQTQKDLATGFCDLKTQLAKCCCDLEKLVTAEGVQTRSFIQNLNVEDLRRRLAQCESATASYFARGVPPTIPTC